MAATTINPFDEKISLLREKAFANNLYVESLSGLRDTLLLRLTAVDVQEEPMEEVAIA